MTKAEKFAEKFDVFGSKRFMLAPEFDVISSLQFKHRGKRDLPASAHELHKRDHVELVDTLLSILFMLPGIRRILLNLDDDHVKLFLKLPCLEAIMSDFF